MTNVTEQMEPNLRLIDVSEIGAILMASRRSKNISLHELSDNLRIPKMYLKSLENSDFANLPGIAYVPGYIRSYCKFTGIDSSALVATYIASVDNDDVNPIYEVPGQALVPKFSNSSIAMIGVFIAIFGYIGWFLLLREEPEQIASIPLNLEQNINKIETLSTNPVNLDNFENNQKNSNKKPHLGVPNSQDDNIAKKSQIALNGIGESPNDESDKKIEIEKSENGVQKADVISNEEPLIVELENDEVSEDTTNLSNSQNGIAVEQKIEASNPSAAVAKGIELSNTLTIRATASAWIEMVNSNGDVITSKLLRSGDSVAASLADRLYLTTGNAGGLMFEMMDVPAFKIGKTGEIVRDLPLHADSIISRKFE